MTKEKDEMSSRVRDKLKHIDSQMEAHLIESVVSLFNQGVLKHYVRNPRMHIDDSNFNMTIDAANGVKFEGREKIIEQSKKIQQLESQLKEAVKVLSVTNSVWFECELKHLRKVPVEVCCDGIDCCCQGMPINPEYYAHDFYERLKNLREKLEQK